MGQYTLTEGFADAAQLGAIIPILKAAIDEASTVPVAERKPSTYLNAMVKILQAVSPVADSIDDHIKSA